MPLRLFFILFTLLLSACKPVTQTPLLPPLQLHPASLGQSISVVQRLRFKLLHQDTITPSVPPIDTLLEITPQQLRLAALALDKRILTLTWDGQKLNVERHIQLPRQVDEQRILRDIQFAYWPAAQLQTALPATWRVQDTPQQRQLWQQDTLMMSIRYQGPQAWLGHTTLTNYHEAYQLDIESLSQASRDQLP